MSTAADFLKAARPELPRIIGLQMRPYCLAHHIALCAFNSSFVVGIPRFDDLIVGVFICSQTWEEWEAWRNSWKLPVFLKLWGKFSGKFDVKRSAAVFMRYIEDGSSRPEVAVPSGGTTLAAPWECRLKLFLIRELRLTVSEAMNYPLALAWYEYCAAAETKGEITLITEADDAALNFSGSDRMRELVRESEAQARREVEEMKAKASVQKEEAN